MPRGGLSTLHLDGGTMDANKIQSKDEIFKASSSFAMFSLLICTDSIMLCL